MQPFLGIILFVLTSCCTLVAHPTGNMIVVGETVIWTYIDPVDDPEHHAAVMIWKKGKKPIPWITSVYPASDFMLYKNEEDIYIIERRFISEKDYHEIRILKTRIGAGMEEIWSWMKDEFRIGEGGFVMNSDTSVLFASYPNVYHLKKGGSPALAFKFKAPIKRLRGVTNNQLLLLSDNDCWLTDHTGKKVKRWKKLIRKKIKNPPLDRNQIFDMDYQDGVLLLAYWGNRSFEMINARGLRQILLKEEAPFTPHWVAFWKDTQLLFASELQFDGGSPIPRLIAINGKKEKKEIWIQPE